MSLGPVFNLSELNVPILKLYIYHIVLFKGED